MGILGWISIIIGASFPVATILFNEFSGRMLVAYLFGLLFNSIGVAFIVVPIAMLYYKKRKKKNIIDDKDQEDKQIINQ